MLIIAKDTEELKLIKRELEDINLSLKVISHRMTAKEADNEWLNMPF
jgi:hypothetical protein